MRHTLPLCLIVLVLAAAAVAQSPAPAIADSGEVDVIEAPELVELGTQIIVSCNAPIPEDGQIVYDWRVIGKRCSFERIGDGREIHVWSEPGQVRVELCIATVVAGKLQPIVRRDATIEIVDEPPAPDPHDEFAAKARAAIASEADRLDIAALAGSMSHLIASDGRLAKPLILTTADMGRTWAELQRVYHGSDAPYGDRLRDFEAVAAEWLTASLQLTGDALPLTDERRALAAAWFAQLQGALQ